MTLTIPIPDQLGETLRRNIDGDLNSYAREALAVQLYRERKLSHGKFAKLLGIGRGQVDEVLARHGVVDEFTAEEIAAQVRASRDVCVQVNKG